MPEKNAHDSSDRNHTMTYLERQDFSIWRVKANFLKNRLQRIRKAHKGGNYKTAMFAEYLQFMEVFLINYFIITELDLFGNAFLSTGDMNKKIGRAFFRAAKGVGLYIPDTRLKPFLSKYVLPFDASQRVFDMPSLPKSYFFGLQSSILDYARHRQFLNSFKHGYRFTMTGSARYTQTIQVDGEIIHEREREFNSFVAYLHKIKEKIYDVQLAFDWRTPYYRILLVENILENARVALISNEFPRPTPTIFSFNKQTESYLLDEILVNTVPL